MIEDIRHNQLIMLDIQYHNQFYAKPPSIFLDIDPRVDAYQRIVLAIPNMSYIALGGLPYTDVFQYHISFANHIE